MTLLHVLAWACGVIGLLAVIGVTGSAFALMFGIVQISDAETDAMLDDLSDSGIPHTQQLGRSAQAVHLDSKG